MREESTEEIYKSINSVWPQNNRWYDYTHQKIIQFILTSLKNRLNMCSVYLNAGSGGSTYDLPGTCYHVDIAESLIHHFPNYVVASIENLPFPISHFDAIICVGSVLNYCDAVQSIRELARVLKPGGYMVLEFERSNTGELWGSKEYGKGGTFQKYEYMGHVHTLCLYSERLIVKLLQRYGLQIIKYQRFHCLSALINRLTKQEEASGRFGRLDTILTPVSYLMAHNTIMLCKKGL